MSEQTAEIDNVKTAMVPMETSSAMSPMEIIQLAVMRPDFDVEKLKELVALQKEFQAEQAKREFAVAMNKAQSEMKAVIRDKQNDHTKKMYPTLDAVSTTIKPTYTANGFSLTFGEAESPLDKHCRMCVTIQHVGGHSEERHVDLPISESGTGGKQMLTPIHAKGAWSTYAQRYLTCMVFSVTIADQDTDGNTKDVISESAVETLNDMLAQCRAVGNPVEGKRLVAFLKTVGVDDGGTIGDITQSKFLTAVGLLTKCISSAAKKAEVAS